MLVYTKDSVSGAIVKSTNVSWRNLDGGNILPGFSVEADDLNAVMNTVRF